MRSILLSAVAIAALSTGVASAQSQGGGSVSAGYTVIDGDGGDLGAITLRGGYDFTQHFGIEGEGHIGVKDEEFMGVDISLDYGLAAYGVARLPVAENGSNIFLRAGYGVLSIEGSAGGITVSEDVDGFAFGIGGEFLFFANQGLRLDYTVFDGDDGEADTYGASWVIRY